VLKSRKKKKRRRAKRGFRTLLPYSVSPTRGGRLRRYIAVHPRPPRTDLLGERGDELVGEERRGVVSIPSLSQDTQGANKRVPWLN